MNLYLSVFLSFGHKQRQTHTDWQPGTHTHTHTYCGPTSREAAARKASGDGLIDPLVKMGDIPPTSISIKPLRLEAFQGLLLFLFRGEPRKIYRQLMVSGRKALLEYIKSTYRRRESLPCELDCFCSKLSVSEKDGRGHVLKARKKKRWAIGERIEKGMSFWDLMDGYDSRNLSSLAHGQL